MRGFWRYGVGSVGDSDDVGCVGVDGCRVGNGIAESGWRSLPLRGLRPYDVGGFGDGDDIG